MNERALVFAAVAFSLQTYAGASFAIEKGTPPNLPPPPAPAPVSPAPARQATVTSAPVSSASAHDAPSKDSGSLDAREPDTRVFLAPLLGVASNDLSFGVGLRGGKTLDNHIYLGGSLVYHFGQSESGTAVVNGISSSWSASSSAFIIGPEGGYDFQFGRVLVRPYLGLGLAIVSGSVAGAGVSAGASDTRFVIWPGGSVTYDLPDSAFFIGGDLHFVTVPGGPAVAVFAMGGMHFGS